MEQLIEAKRRVVVPYKTENGSTQKFTFEPPPDKFVNRVDDALLKRLMENESCKRYFDDGTLCFVAEARAQSYQDGDAVPAAPEVPPMQAAAESVAENAFPKPIKGKR